ncbi:MAG TPA: SAM-dependent methyltransferase, partial [Phycicoccus sp.]|nr:SAM-dependent methyltransferase [Phycicoccus sp.]
MREIKVIGIGAGSPGHLTQEAIAALRAVDVFLVADKGSVKDELVAVRRAICEEFIDGIEGEDYRFLTVPDPVR